MPTDPRLLSAAERRDRAMRAWREGRLEDAVARYDEAIRTLEGATGETAELLRANVLQNKALALHDLRRDDEAIEILLDAIDAFRRVSPDGTRADVLPLLAVACQSAGTVMRSRGRPEEALGLQDEAIALWERALAEGNAGRAADLASTLLNKANALEAVGRLSESLACFERAIALRRPLLEAGDERMRGDIAKVQAQMASVLESLGRMADAADAVRAALPALRLAVAAGRCDLAHTLAWLQQAYHHLLVDPLPEPEALASLQDRLLDRFQRARERGDLHEATWAAREAIEVLRARGSASATSHVGQFCGLLAEICQARRMPEEAQAAREEMRAAYGAGETRINWGDEPPP